jgi:hypothetical protein
MDDIYIHDPSTIPEVEGFRLKIQAAFPKEEPIWTETLEVFFMQLDELLGSDVATTVMDEILESTRARVLVDEDGESLDRKPNPYHRYLYNSLKNQIISYRVQETGEDHETAERKVVQRIRGVR